MKTLLKPTLMVVILAAGFSTRLGRPKALVRIRGTSLLRRTAQALGGLKPLAVCVIVPPRHARYAHELRGTGARLIENRLRSSGLSSSVRRGLQQGRYASGTLLIPVDLADLERCEVRRLVRRWLGNRRKVVARRAGQSAVTPLILPKHRYRAVTGLRGDSGLRAAVATLRPADRVLVTLPSARRDIDTLEDLWRARRSRHKGAESRQDMPDIGGADVQVRHQPHPFAH